MPLKRRLILASTSPRRRDILKQLKIEFEIQPPDFKEISREDLNPEEEVLFLAEGKARSIENQYNDALILGCDTMVVLAGKKLGKPQDADEAKTMLKSLSGRSHEVLTGLCLIDTKTGQVQRQCAKTRVSFRVILPREIDQYVQTGDPMDKAGAYAIQNQPGTWVEEISGEVENVVGLPLGPLKHWLKLK